MALTSRQLIRDEISTLFDGVAALQENLAYPPLALEGKSPLFYLHADGTLPLMLSLNANQFDHYFIGTIAVNREKHGASGAEDLLDTIWTAILQEVRDTPTGTYYMSLDVAANRSRPYFATVDGIAYRFEELYFMARSNITG